jgi:4-hydroxy-tetrahydrodipicolinate reductase
LKLALIGLGTTGKTVAEYLLSKQVLAMVLCREGSPKAGQDLGTILHRPTTGITLESTDNLGEKLLHYQPDVLIDFSRPAFLSEHLATLAKAKVNVVTAVTGYSEMDLKRIRLVAQSGKIGVVTAPNITYGVNVLLLMAQVAAQLQLEYDFEIIEENHRNKLDSPSGTANKIASAIKATISENGGEDAEIPIHSIRSGDIVGRHKILVTGKYDQIEIAHTAFSREAYAEGAYKAAQFVRGRSGFYEMNDVFRLEKNHYKICRSLSS